MVATIERLPLLVPPRGLVTVELADAETGRIVQREQGENFLSADVLDVARWWQRMMWGIFNPVQVNDAAGYPPSRMPTFPADHLATWNDSSAEDAANEHRVEKPIVAWASRWPVGSPSGKRGVVNITESEFTDAHSKWVFDWTTSQGNGTFRSVGWTRLYEALDAPIPRFPEDGGVTFTGGGTGFYQGGLYWDGTNWFTFDYDSGTPTSRLRSYPAAGGAATTVFAIPTSAFKADSSTKLYPFGLTKIGTDWYFVGHDNSGSGSPRAAKVNAAGAQQWAVNLSALGDHIFSDVTTDGTNLFASCSDGKVYRLNPADGSITATLTPSWTTSPLVGIVYDADDGNFWVLDKRGSQLGMLAKMDSAGTLVGAQMIFTPSTQNIAATSPFTGTYRIPPASSGDPYGIGHNSTGVTAADGVNSQALGGMQSGILTTSWGYTATDGDFCPLAMKDGMIWLGAYSGNPPVINKAWPVEGHNLGTRVLLDADVTKTNAQTMKITYQFDFS